MGLGVDVFAGYGMSETGPLLTVAHLKSSDLAGDPDQQVEVRARAGRTCPLVDLQIVDPDMKRLPHDGESAGEIIVRAPWLTNGYFDNPDASEQLWAGGYLHTDDIGVITPDGYLEITDRIKDVIKSGGEWISSLQLEDIIMQCAGVAECAVIGIKDARWGERPLALIVRDPKTEPPVCVEDIKAHVMAQSDKGVISKFAVPQKILFVDALAKTSVGKFDKKALRAQYGDAA
jgi:fatty-acyl-CoA synthase